MFSTSVFPKWLRHCALTLYDPAPTQPKCQAWNQQKQSKNGEELVLQDIMLVDPSGTMKLVLWQEFAELLIVGETYSFQDVRIKQNKFTAEIFIKTSKSDTKIALGKTFEEVLPIVVQSTYLPENKKILGVS